MKKESSASIKKRGHADNKIELKRKKDLFKGELNPAKDHNTRDTSFIFSIKTLYSSSGEQHSTKKNPLANFTVIFQVSYSIYHFQIFACLDTFFIFCFKVILSDNFSFPGQPID